MSLKGSEKRGGSSTPETLIFNSGEAASPSAEAEGVAGKQGASAERLFSTQACEPSVSVIREFCDFLRENRKWWLAPIIISLLLFSLLVILSSQSAIGPWIYTFF